MPDTAWRPSVSIIVPAYNEAENLQHTIRRAIGVLEEMRVDYELVVIDDGSRDDSARVCVRLMREIPVLRVVSHERNKGYGRAVRTGITHSRNDVIVLLPADLQYSFDEIPRLVALTAEYDIIAGCRTCRADPLFRRVNAYCWKHLVRLVLGMNLQDVNGGFKAFRRSVFDGIEMRATGALIDTEIFARTRRRGARILEIPVAHYPRARGRATGARPSVIFRSCYELWKMYSELRG